MLLMQVYTTVAYGNICGGSGDTHEGGVYCLSTASKAVIPENAIIVPDDFSTIQEAVYNVSWGGTVFVRNGIYSELITVNKSITLIGEDRENTIILGHPVAGALTSAAIEVQTADVRIYGFTIKNAQVGIKIAAELHNTYEPSRCKIKYNIITENEKFGIFAESGYDHDVLGNTITGNGEAGIYFRSVFNSYISINNITENGELGIVMDSSGTTVIRYNNISCNSGGVELHRSGWLHIYGNNITDNQEYGIEFGEGCRNSTISTNNIKRNNVGISLLNFGLEGAASLGAGNQVNINNIVDNSQQVFVDREWDMAETFPERGNATDVVSWNSSERGNYWGDYLTKHPGAAEIGDTKVGDTTYVIDENNADYFPLTSPVKIPLAPSLNPSGSPVKTVALVVAVATVLVVVFFGYRTKKKGKGFT